MFEYRVVMQPTGTREVLEEEAKRLGSVGWEAVGLAGPTSGPYVLAVLFKRELAPWPAPAEVEPAWSADPTGRFESRFWDGLRWTEHVSSRGATAVDWPLR